MTSYDNDNSHMSLIDISFCILITMEFCGISLLDLMVCMVDFTRRVHFDCIGKKEAVENMR